VVSFCFYQPHLSSIREESPDFPKQFSDKKPLLGDVSMVYSDGIF